MKCNKCNNLNNLKTYDFMIGKKRKSIYLCDNCLNFNITEEIGSLSLLYHLSYEINYLKKKCNKCLISLKEVVLSGSLGCNHCYDFFGDELKYLMNNRFDDIVDKHSLSKLLDAKKILKIKLDVKLKNEAYEEAEDIKKNIISIDNIIF